MAGTCERGNERSVSKGNLLTTCEPISFSRTLFHGESKCIRYRPATGSVRRNGQTNQGPSNCGKYLVSFWVLLTRYVDSKAYPD